MSEQLQIGSKVFHNDSYYEIVSTYTGEDLLGSDAYSFYYLAYDRLNDNLVELREYFRAGFASRDADIVVPPSDAEKRVHFDGGKVSFDEASLARDDRIAFFSQNGTSYLALPIDIVNSGYAQKFDDILNDVRSKSTPTIVRVRKNKTQLWPFALVAVIFMGGGAVLWNSFGSSQASGNNELQAEILDEQAAQQEAELIEAERKAAELAAQEAEAVRLAEEERVAAELAEAERVEAERKAAELAAQEAEAARLAEEERVAAELAEAERVEAERKATELAAQELEAARLAEEERVAAELAEAERVEAERKVAELAEQEAEASSEASTASKALSEDEIAALKLANQIYTDSIIAIPEDDEIDRTVLPAPTDVNCSNNISKFEISSWMDSKPDLFGELSVIRASRLAGSISKGEPLDAALTDAWGNAAVPKQNANLAICNAFPLVCGDLENMCNTE